MQNFSKNSGRKACRNCSEGSSIWGTQGSPFGPWLSDLDTFGVISYVVWGAEFEYDVKIVVWLRFPGILLGSEVKPSGNYAIAY